MENKKTVSVLNDLVQIINDRIEGFGKVDGKIWERYPDIKEEYERMISRSKVMKNELIDLIREKGGEAQDSPSVAGAIHRTWIDIKNSLPVNTEESTLENVVFGERAAVETYQKALDSGDLDDQSYQIVAEQLQNLKSSYEQFKNIEEYKKKD